MAINEMPKQHLGAYAVSSRTPTNEQLGITMVKPRTPTARDLIIKALRKQVAQEQPSGVARVQTLQRLPVSNVNKYRVTLDCGCSFDSNRHFDTGTELRHTHSK